MEKELTKTREDIERITRHDLKSPLNLIINYPKFIKKGDNLTQKQIEQLDRICTAGNKLLNMINISLDLYKMEQGSYQFYPWPVDIMKVIDDIVQDNRNLIHLQHAKIEISINGNLATEDIVFEINGEKLLFYSMLANLIKNSIEASPKNETIAIQLSNTSNLSISINNQGAVPEEIRETFFEKYTTSGKKEGTGLGTYSAKLIAETMGGRISMISSEEKGTTVTITFPKVI